MRKHQQLEVLDMLQTLHEAHDELRKSLQQEAIVGLLADCQDFALQIGEYIEGIEGEGTQTVTTLEEYCDKLYRLSNESEASSASIGKRLDKQLIIVENCIKNELKPNRIEIVFLSYKASMSDSIESIYLAAKEAPDCDAYWIPVPYFDRRTDGSVRDMHYEGADCYSANMEVTDWKEYNIEERHPDVIFTFNPYDSDNYISSVDPDYYCERLRNFTDLLIYIPYFVVTANVPEHFITLPGCMYSHKVIVQSERIRNEYIHIFKEAFGNRFGKPEDKFIALGSPKYDKVINNKREDCKLPDEWEKLIGDKKIVLYNTSISTMLSGNEQYLKKLRFTFNTFRGNKDVVLWWRPHPLSEATYRSMRPQLIGEYEQIIMDYKRNSWGILDDSGQKENTEKAKSSNFIYDDSSELNRAICYADAYYGDWSSLVTLFGVTGKPVVIQYVYNTNNAVLTNRSDDGSSIYDGYFRNVNSSVYDSKLGNIADFFTSSLKGETVVSSKRQEHYLKTSENKDGTAGKAIYQYALNTLK